MLSRTALAFLRQRSLTAPTRLAFSNSYTRGFASNKEPLKKVFASANERIKPQPSDRPTQTYNPVAAPDSPPKPEHHDQPSTDSDIQKQATRATNRPKAGPREASEPVEDIGSQPTRPLPDLTKGIPSTLEAELSQSQQRSGSEAEGKFNITEDPASPPPGPGGRGGGELPRSAYVSSSDRRRTAVVKYVYLGLAFGATGYMLYLGRDWESEEEKQAHPEVGNGYSPGLVYNRIRARLGTTVSYYSDPVSPKLLPDEDADPNNRMPFVLVLSLDDMLVHSEWSRQTGWRIAKRPGVDYFIRYLSQYYELVLFTSQPYHIAEQIMRKLDPFGIIRWPLTREHTAYRDSGYVKDISGLNRDLKKVIMIDTNAHHVSAQPENAIVLPKWTGDPRDQTLIQLIPFLEYLATMGFDDTRTVLKSFEGRDIPIEFQRRIAALREKHEKEQSSKRGNRPGKTIGGLGSLFGTKQQPAGVIGSGVSSNEGRMIWDIIREQGQKNYEVFEKNIRENGAKWLAEREADEKKAQEEFENSRKSGMFGFFGAQKGAEEKK